MIINATFTEIRSTIDANFGVIARIDADKTKELEAFIAEIGVALDGIIDLQESLIGGV